MKYTRVQCFITILVLLYLSYYFFSEPIITKHQDKREVYDERVLWQRKEGEILSPHSPIRIDGNRELIDQAATEGWSGSGSQSDPYTIDGLHFSYCGDILFALRSTNLYLDIKNCVFHEGIYSGLNFWNVSNVRLIKNTVHGANPYGIYLSSSRNFVLENNTSYNNSRDGVFVYSSSNIVIKNNIFLMNQEDAIHLSASHDITLMENQLTGNLNGIFIEFCSDCLVSSNRAENNTRMGMFTFFSWNIDYLDNKINSNGFSGFSSMYSYHMRMINNRASKNIMSGFVIYTTEDSLLKNNLIEINIQSGIVISNSINNTVTLNTMISNGNYGVFLREADETTVTWNNFTDNNQGGISQASDGGENNTFQNNFWNEWSEPDDDEDGIVDSVYIIEGDPGNIDPFPQSKIDTEESTTSNTTDRVGGFLFNELVTLFMIIVVMRRTKCIKKYLDD